MAHFKIKIFVYRGGSYGPAADAQEWLEHILNLHNCDKCGSGRGDYRPVDAHAREVAVVLESRDIEPRFHYPRG